MSSLDTNVLMRLLVQANHPEDVAQAKLARRLVARAIESGQHLFVPITVALELEWVLRTRYKQTKAQLCETLSQLLSTNELRFDQESALEEALFLYQSGGADFADCLHAAIAIHAGEAPLLTFDRTAAKVDGARLLGR